MDKPGTAVPREARVAVLAPKEPFVSRAGRKLAHALDHFGLDPAGWTCLDVGASTGGFTDCLLQRGAARVYALDVGYGQLDHRLRTDPRVVVMERINARNLGAGALPEPCDLITIDVSFISLLEIRPRPVHGAPGIPAPLKSRSFIGAGSGGAVDRAEMHRAGNEAEVHGDQIARLGQGAGARGCGR